jgi:hypothetical protein
MVATNSSIFWDIKSWLLLSSPTGALGVSQSQLEPTVAFCTWFAMLAVGFMPVSCLAYASTLKMDVIRSPRTSTDFQCIAQHDIPDERTLSTKSDSFGFLIL